MSKSKNKKKGLLVKLVSAETGYFQVRKRSAKKTDKLSLRKYDPRLRRHVVFKEEKMK